jgi:hypothetical protein
LHDEFIKSPRTQILPDFFFSFSFSAFRFLYTCLGVHFPHTQSSLNSHRRKEKEKRGEISRSSGTAGESMCSLPKETKKENRRGKEKKKKKKKLGSLFFFLTQIVYPKTVMKTEQKRRKTPPHQPRDPEEKYLFFLSGHQSNNGRQAK